MCNICNLLVLLKVLNTAIYFLLSCTFESTTGLMFCINCKTWDIQSNLLCFKTEFGPVNIHWPSILRNQIKSKLSPSSRCPSWHPAVRQTAIGLLEFLWGRPSDIPCRCPWQWCPTPENHIYISIAKLMKIGKTFSFSWSFNGDVTLVF